MDARLFYNVLNDKKELFNDLSDFEKKCIKEYSNDFDMWNIYNTPKFCKEVLEYVNSKIKSSKEDFSFLAADEDSIYLTQNLALMNEKLCFISENNLRRKNIINHLFNAPAYFIRPELKKNENLILFCSYIKSGINLNDVFHYVTDIYEAKVEKVITLFLHQDYFYEPVLDSIKIPIEALIILNNGVINNNSNFIKKEELKFDSEFENVAFYEPKKELKKEITYPIKKSLCEEYMKHFKKFRTIANLSETITNLLDFMP